MTKRLLNTYRTQGQEIRRKDLDRASIEEMKEALQPDIDFCSKCYEHTEFVLINGELLSVCCGTLPISVD